MVRRLGAPELPLRSARARPRSRGGARAPGRPPRADLDDRVPVRTARQRDPTRERGDDPTALDERADLLVDRDRGLHDRERVPDGVERRFAPEEGDRGEHAALIGCGRLRALRDPARRPGGLSGERRARPQRRVVAAPGDLARREPERDLLDDRERGIRAAPRDPARARRREAPPITARANASASARANGPRLDLAPAQATTRRPPRS